MSRAATPPPDVPLQKELRRLGWALVLYGVVLLGLGAWAVRLGLTHRHFEPLTVAPVVDSVDTAEEDGAQDSAPAVQEVRGEVP